jgi:hypothetical protein
MLAWCGREALVVGVTAKVVAMGEAEALAEASAARLAVAASGVALEEPLPPPATPGDTVLPPSQGVSVGAGEGVMAVLAVGVSVGSRGVAVGVARRAGEAVLPAPLEGVAWGVGAAVAEPTPREALLSSVVRGEMEGEPLALKCAELRGEAES